MWYGCLCGPLVMSKVGPSEVCSKEIINANDPRKFTDKK